MTNEEMQKQCELANENLRLLNDLLYLYGACIKYENVSEAFMAHIIKKRQELQTFYETNKLL